jgi:hypothetical protein
MLSRKGLPYWISIIGFLAAVAAAIAHTAVRLDHVEQRVSHVPATEWDLALLKGFAHASRPMVYDSVMDRLIRERGPRPQEQE